MEKNISQQLLEFIENSPTCFHAVQAMTDILSAEGFTELKENQKWHIENGGRYFVTRNGSSLTAFTVPVQEMKGMHIIASHSDSPSFKIKENPELESEGRYIRLNVEGYGGMIRAPWFDRPLSVAGRVIVKDKAQGGFRSILVDIGRDLVMIPNLAIHMDRQINDSCKYNIQKDMLPIYGDLSAKGTFMKLIAESRLQPLSEGFFDEQNENNYYIRGVSSQETGRNIWRYTVSLTTKKWGAGQSRGLPPPFFMTH